MSIAEELNGHEAPSPQLYVLAPQDLQRGWHLIEPVLSKACAESRGEFTLNRILANLEHWPILAIAEGERVKAVMVTCVTQFEDGRRRLECLLAAGGHAKEWPQADDQLDEFARSLGCSSVRIPCARKGWAKALPHWTIRGYVMERKI